MWPNAETKENPCHYLSLRQNTIEFKILHRDGNLIGHEGAKIGLYYCTIHTQPPQIAIQRHPVCHSAPRLAWGLFVREMCGQREREMCEAEQTTGGNQRVQGSTHQMHIAR